MLGSTVLEVAMGMICVYLLLSVICSAVKEWIAGVLHLRARTLERGICNLFQSPEGQQLKEQLYSHALIRGLTQQGKIQVSYLPARTFALALLDTIAPTDEAGPKSFQEIRTAIAGMKCEEIKQGLLPLVDTAEGDLQKARIAIGTWFDDAMDRVSGWYKAQAQSIIVVLAALLCICLNVDSVAIARTLWRDPTARAITVSQAQQAIKGASLGANQAQTALNQLNLPIGWSGPNCIPNSFGEWLLKGMGLALTTVAVSLNAPFWFDLLNKLVNLRISGEPPEKASDKSSKEAADS